MGWLRRLELFVPNILRKVDRAGFALDVAQRVEDGARLHDGVDPCLEDLELFLPLRLLVEDEGMDRGVGGVLEMIARPPAHHAVATLLTGLLSFLEDCAKDGEVGLVVGATLLLEVGILLDGALELAEVERLLGRRRRARRAGRRRGSLATDWSHVACVARVVVNWTAA